MNPSPPIGFDDQLPLEEITQMTRFAFTRMLPALVLATSLAACGAEPAATPADDGSLPADTPTDVAVTTPKRTASATATATVKIPTAKAPPPAAGTDPGKLIPAFTAEGTAGEATRTVNSREPGAVTVYCAGSTNCPITNKYAERMKDIETAYAAKGVQFIWLYPNRTEADEKKSKWHEENGLSGTFVIDRDAKIAKVLKIKRTPEIVVTAADGKITYRGAIDDGKGNPAEAEVPWLANAIDATLAGEPVEIEKTVPSG